MWLHLGLYSEFFANSWRGLLLEIISSSEYSDVSCDHLVSINNLEISFQDRKGNPRAEYVTTPVKCIAAASVLKGPNVRTSPPTPQSGHPPPAPTPLAWSHTLGHSLTRTHLARPGPWTWCRLWSLPPYVPVPFPARWSCNLPAPSGRLARKQGGAHCGKWEACRLLRTETSPSSSNRS